MRLQLRASLGILSTIVVVSIVLVSVARVLYLNGFHEIEAREAEDAVRRVSSLISDDLGQLDVLARDWASWDDTYNFVASRNPAFVESNLGADEMSRLGLSAMAILGNDGNVAYSFDFGKEMRAELGKSLGLPRGESSPAKAEQVSGLIFDGGGIDLVAVRPLLRSDGSGPGRGFLVMAKRVDAGRLERYGRLIGAAVGIRALPGAGEGTAGSGMGSGARALVSAKGDSVSGSLLLSDIDGLPCALAEARIGRETYHYGSASFAILSLVMLSLIAVLGGIALLGLNAMVLSRIRRLGDELDLISAMDDGSMRVTVSGNDELTALGRVMNRSLESLHASITERETMLREIHHRVKNNLQVISSLLGLQANSACEETAGALEATKRRVDAMAFVHEELFEEPRMDGIRLDRFLARLALEMEQSSGGDGRLRTEVEACEIRLDISHAIPVGIIAGEILDNAFRHAFAPEEGGNVRIRASSDGHMISIEVLDDGLGIPDESARRTGLGLSLVRSLSEQIGAAMSLDRREGAGTRFLLVFSTKEGFPRPEGQAGEDPASLEAAGRIPYDYAI
jgi:two-component sensor histidine kinase